jgi:hypothetical protein
MDYYDYDSMIEFQNRQSAHYRYNENNDASGSYDGEHNGDDIDTSQAIVYTCPCPSLQYRSDALASVNNETNCGAVDQDSNSASSCDDIDDGNSNDTKDSII